MEEDPFEQLLYTLAGCEVAILNAMEQKDWVFLKALRAQKAKLLERLRRKAYGLPEQTDPPTED